MPNRRLLQSGDYRLMQDGSSKRLLQYQTSTTFKKNNPGCECCFDCCDVCGNDLASLQGGSNTPKIWTVKDLYGANHNLKRWNTLLDGTTAVTTCTWGKELAAPITVGSCTVYGLLLQLGDPASSSTIYLAGVDSDLTTPLVVWQREQEPNTPYEFVDCKRKHWLPWSSGCSITAGVMVSPSLYPKDCYTVARDTVSAPCSLADASQRLQEVYRVYWDNVPISDGSASDCEILRSDYVLEWDLDTSAGQRNFFTVAGANAYGGNTGLITLHFLCGNSAPLLGYTGHIRILVGLTHSSGSPRYANWRLDVPTDEFTGVGPWVLPFINEPNASGCTVTGSKCYVAPATNP